MVLNSAMLTVNEKSNNLYPNINFFFFFFFWGGGVFVWTEPYVFLVEFLKFMLCYLF